MFMVASVFRHMKTGPLRGEVQCQTVWAHLLYVNNFVWNFAPTLEEGFDKYGGGVSKNHANNVRLESHQILSVHWSNLVHGK